MQMYAPRQAINRPSACRGTSAKVAGVAGGIGFNLHGCFAEGFLGKACLDPMS